MWGSFFASVGAALAFLYLPGYLLMRAVRAARIVSAACAPLVTIALYGVLTIVYAKIGVFCSWATLFGPALALSLTLCAVGTFIGRGKGVSLDLPARPSARLPRGFDWLCLGLYVALGVAIATFIYARSLDGAGSFVQEYDNLSHLGTTYGFLLSGDWSPFNATMYPTPEAARIDPLPGGGFYPTAWNCLCALVASALGVSSSFAANTVNFLFIGVVFPSSLFLLMRMVFRDALRIVPFGAFVSLAFTAFPWGFFVFGPLYPNMVAFTMVPAAAFCFMVVIEEDALRKARVVAATVFGVGVLAFALSQPNAVFTLAVLLAPLCVYRAAQAADRLKVPEGRRTHVRIACAAAAIAAIVVIWVALYNAPFLHSVVTHDWPAFKFKSQALVDVALLAFRIPAYQLVLAGLVAVGILYTLKHRRYLWLSVSYAIMSLFYIVAVTSNDPVKFLLTGFWYTDSFRLAASAAIFAVPLAAIGLWLAARGLAWILRRATDLAASRVPLVAACAAALLFVLLNFYPSFSNPTGAPVVTPFGSIASTLEALNSAANPQIYDAEEAAFVREVKETVPEGALVLNEPDDGSAYAYCVDGLNVYYRYLRTYGGDDETGESKLIRTRLDELASNDEVREAVRNVGGSYVLQLDQGKGEASPRLFTYENGKNWQGLESIDDDTPGFEVVLARDDMRLYKITA